MTEYAVLIEKIENLPQKYFKNVFNYVENLEKTEQNVDADIDMEEQEWRKCLSWTKL